MMEHVKLLSKYGTDYTLVVAENVMLRERCAALEAHLAAMREALEAAIAKPAWEFQHVAKADVMEILDTTDAGRELLERLRKAEAERDSYAIKLGCVTCQHNQLVEGGPSLCELHRAISKGYQGCCDWIREAE